MARSSRCVFGITSLVLVLLGVRASAQQASLPATLATTTQSLQLSSPLDYQVFQRRTKLSGSIVIRGHAELPVTAVEARLAGNSLAGPLAPTWHRISFNAQTGDFYDSLATTAGGFYSLEVRVLHRGHAPEEVVVPHVGVGEVFVVSGQSNSTNYGETPQVTETQKVTTFDGKVWRLANDPQPGVQDNSSKGSFIPPFGDALFRKYGVPIGIASVGHGSTSVRQWLPAGTPVEVMPTMTRFVNAASDGTLVCDGTLFHGMMARIQELGPQGFRAVLWHQGESDSHQPPEHEIPAETYRRMLEQIILSTRSQAGWEIPWFVAQVSYHTPADTSCPPLREAQRSLWQSGIALEGPDTDTLTSAYRQDNGKGIHLNDAGLKAHGLLWAHWVELYLDPLLR
jgi:Carbohydrate esterase, sialic acid-specific acetylesterase